MLIFTSSNIRPLYIISGESNSGGLGFNSDIPASELQPNQKVQIWNNDTNSGFADLQIGVNNLRGHTGLTGVSGYDTTRHGLERSLALDATRRIWLVKAGQGGSTIGQWAANSAYSNTLTTRVNGAIAAMQAARLRPLPIFVWWLGINDAVAGTTPTTWRTLSEAHFARVRTLLGANTPIYMMKIMPNTPAKIAINQQIDLMAGGNNYAIDVSGADNMVQPDTNHWTAQGVRVAGISLTSAIRSSIGGKSRL